MSGIGKNDDNDFDSDDRLADDWESSLADGNPLWALTVVSAFWLVVFVALFGLAEAGRWVLSLFGL